VATALFVAPASSSWRGAASLKHVGCRRRRTHHRPGRSTWGRYPGDRADQVSRAVQAVPGCRRCRGLRAGQGVPSGRAVQGLQAVLGLRAVLAGRVLPALLGVLVVVGEQPGWVRAILAVLGFRAGRAVRSGQVVRVVLVLRGLGCLRAGPAGRGIRAVLVVPGVRGCRAGLRGMGDTGAGQAERRARWQIVLGLRGFLGLRGCRVCRAVPGDRRDRVLLRCSTRCIRRRSNGRYGCRGRRRCRAAPDRPSSAG
jgi:hypothetical protein